MRPYSRQLAALLAAAASAALAVQGTPVAAQETVAPRGNSGVEQYFEVVPGPGGDERPGAGADGGNDGGGGEPALSPEQERQLASQGAAGRDLATVVNAQGAGEPAKGKGKRETVRSERRAGGRDDVPDSDPTPGTTLGDALAADADEGGMGLLLPLLLLGSAAAIAAVALMRRRA